MLHFTPPYFVLLFNHFLGWKNQNKNIGSLTNIKKLNERGLARTRITTCILRITSEYRIDFSNKDLTGIRCDMRYINMVYSPSKLKALHTALSAKTTGEMLKAIMHGYPKVLGKDFLHYYKSIKNDEFLKEPFII